MLSATSVVSEVNREKARYTNAPYAKLVHTLLLLVALSSEICRSFSYPTSRQYKQPGGGYSQIFGLTDAREGIVYADIDLGDIDVSKHYVDTVGHHTKPGSLSLKVKASTVKRVHHT